MLDDRTTVWWVDWREHDEAIPNNCEAILQTGHLAGELVETDSEAGFEVYVRYRDRRLKVPLTISADDRHITLLTLNEALSPDYEVRFCVDSWDGDTLAFVPLPVSLWGELERQYGPAVAARFARIAVRPNLFTDPLPFGRNPRSAASFRSQAQASTRLMGMLRQFFRPTIR